MIAQLASIIAGIGWEPEIRGALTVAVAGAVLIGSVWLLLVTNTGTRLGSLIALAGFWGWMVIMGIIWWIYGIGIADQASRPVWEVHEINADEPGADSLVGIQESQLGNVSNLPDPNCFPDVAPFGSTDVGSFSEAAINTRSNCNSRAIELLMAFDGPERQSVLQELLNPQKDSGKIVVGDGGQLSMDDGAITDPDDLFRTLISRHDEEIREGVVDRVAVIRGADENDPRVLEGEALEEEVQSLIDRRNTRINALTLSALDAVGPAIVNWGVEQDYVQLNGWNLLSTAESGEAVASATEGITSEGVFDGHEFIVLDSFQQGGKPVRNGDGMFTRIWHKITSTARITHPTNYAVVQAQVAVDKEAVPGELPPLPEAEPEAATVSVVMIRNLGNLRLVPAIFTVISLLAFLASCLALHYRDLELMRRLEENPQFAA